MAIALVASVNATPGSNGGATGAINTTGADLLVVSIASYGAGTAPTVSDSKGNTWIGLTQRINASARHRLYYCLAPVVGTGHTVTASASVSYPAIHFYAFSGVASYQTESGASQVSGASLASGSVTPSANGALIVSGNGGQNAVTDSITPSGFALTQKAFVTGTNMQGSFAWQVQATAAAIDPTWGSSPAQGSQAVGSAVFLPTSATLTISVAETVTVAERPLTGPPTIQPNWGSAQVFGGPRYFAPTGGHIASGATTENDIAFRMDQGGTIRNLAARVAVAPGGAASWAFTFRLNGVDQALTVTLAGSTVYAADTTHSFAVAAGDKVTLKLVSSGSPPTVLTGWVWDFEPTDTSVTHYAIGGSIENFLGTTTYLSPFSAGAVGTSSGPPFDALIPLAGTLTSYRMGLSVAPGSGRSRTFVFMKNGSVQDGTGGTPNTTLTISDANLTGTATFSLALNPGDRLRVRATGSGTPILSFGMGSHTFVPTIATEIVFCGSPRDAPFANNTTYSTPMGSSTFATTEHDYFPCPAPLSSITLSTLWVVLESVLSSGTRVFTLRKNSVDTTQTVSIPASGISGGPAVPWEGSAAVTFTGSAVGGDVLSMKCVAVAGGSTNLPKIAMAFDVAPPPFLPVTPPPETVAVTTTATGLLVPRVMQVLLAEDITAGEWWWPPPPSPPSEPGPQVCLPAGYQLTEASLAPPYTEYWENQLNYEGPWPSPGDFTVCFWARMVYSWELRSATPTNDPLSTVEVWGNWRPDLSGSPINNPVDSVGLDVEDLDGVWLDDITSHDWHHVAVVRAGTDTFFSLDNRPFLLLGGALHVTEPWFHEGFAPGTSAPYASWERGFRWTPGIAYYRFWDAILGMNELRQEARARRAVRTADLWRDTPLEGSLEDVTGHGRHWLLDTGTKPAVAVCGNGPLPWVADAVSVQDVAAVTLQAAHERKPVEGLSVRDVVLVRGLLKWHVGGEAVAVQEGASCAPANTVLNRVIRWYLPPDLGSITYTPPTLKGGWTTPAVGAPPNTQKLSTVASGTFGSATYFGGSGYVPVGGTCCCGRHVTDALPAQVIAGAFDVCLFVWDQLYVGATRPRVFRFYLYVTVGDTDAVRGVLLDYKAPFSTGNRWPSSARFWQLEGDATLSAVALQTGDRVVIEYGWITDAAVSTTSTSIVYLLSSSILQPDATPNAPRDELSNPGQSRNGWVEFKSGIKTTALVARPFETITRADAVRPLIPTLARVLSDTISARDLDPWVAANADLTVRVGDDISIIDKGIVARQRAVFDARTVTDRVTAQLRPGLGRWYLSLRPASYTPATWKGTWDITQGRTSGGAFFELPVKLLVPEKKRLSSVDDLAYLTGSVENSATDVDYPIARWVSPGLAAQTISGSVQVGLHFSSFPDPTQSHFNLHVHLWVTQGDSDSVRGTLLTDYRGAAGVGEIPIDIYDGAAMVTAQGLTSVTLLQGDRLVLEVGFRARNTITGNCQGDMYAGFGNYSGTLVFDDIVVPNAVNAYFATWIDFIGSQVLLSPAAEQGVSDARTVLDAVTVLFRTATSRTADESMGVAEAVTALLSNVVTQGGSDALSVTDAVAVTLDIPPPEPLPGMTVVVFDAITTTEERAYDVETSKLEVSVGEDVTVTEVRQMAAFPVVWDGSGTPPAPATIAGDYWIVGV